MHGANGIKILKNVCIVLKEVKLLIYIRFGYKRMF